MHSVRRSKGKVKGCRGSRGRPDPWQKAVYGFEDDWPEACVDSLSIEQCAALIGLACRAYGVEPPPVGFDPRAKLSYCYADGSGIKLARTQRNKFVALHEGTHHIVDRLLGMAPEDHGFEFQGVYFYLIRRAEIAPLSALRAAAKDRGLMWRETSPLQISCQRD